MRARSGVLFDALAAVLDDRPDAAIALDEDATCFVRAGYLVDALAPVAVDALERSRFWVEAERAWKEHDALEDRIARAEYRLGLDGPSSVAADVVTRIGRAS